MLHAILQSASVERLKELLRNRYRKELKISWIKSLSSLHSAEDGFAIRNNHLHIPITVEQHYFAMAMVEEVNQLTKEDHLLISELVKMVLEPEFYNWYLQQLSHNSSTRSESANVIPIFHPFDLNADFSKYAEDPLSSPNVILLQAHDPHLIPRLANEVHEISQRWAFLKFKDIQTQVHSVQDLKSLGSLTLVIDDILELSPEQQILIHQYLLTANPTQEPFLIMGATSEIESLEKQNIIHSGLAKILKHHRLEVDRLPRDSKLLHDTLEIMLES